MGLNFYGALSGRSSRTTNQRTKSLEKNILICKSSFLQILVLIWCCSSFSLNSYVCALICKSSFPHDWEWWEDYEPKINPKHMISLSINIFVTLNSFSSYELDFSCELHDLRIYTAIILRLSSSTRSSSYVDLHQKSIGKSPGFHMQLYSNLSNHTEDV